MFEDIKKDLEKRMASSTQSAKSEMSGIRAGRASPSMLDSIKVEAYGQKMNINQVGNITTPDSRNINVDIWDQNNVKSVEKAIRESDLGINPIVEGNLIRLPLPELTAERREEYSKIAKKISESSKVAIRNIRRDGIERIKKLEKEKGIGKDDAKKHIETIEQVTLSYIEFVDKALKSKEEDLKQI